MKVKLKNGETANVSYNYALRLIEHGEAVFVKAAKKAEKPAEKKDADGT